MMFSSRLDLYAARPRTAALWYVLRRTHARVHKQVFYHPDEYNMCAHVYRTRSRRTFVYAVVV